MKAQESIERYPQKVREYANYAYKSIKILCKKTGPRPVGSESEKQAQEYMKADLEKCCDVVTREEYKCSDKAFMAWVPLGAILILVSTACLSLGLAVASLACCLIALFFIVTEFIFYKPVLDVFFPKKTSGNVVGIRKASGETKKRIIFSGHTDSAFEWTYTYYGGRPAVLGIIITAVVEIVLGIGTSIAYMVSYGIIGENVWSGEIGIVFKVLAVITYVGVPVIVAAVGFTNYNKPVTGANDDLSGTFVSMAVAKFLNDNNIRFENTEVVVLCAGGEEAGLRGSKAYAKAHAEQFKNEKDVETIFVGFDTIRELEFIKIYDKDMTGVVKNDRKTAELVQRAGKLMDLDIPIGAIELGSTDAAAMSQAGIKATSVTAMDPTPARYYHTRLDTEDNLSLGAIETGVKLALETVFLFDEEGVK